MCHTIVSIIRQIHNARRRSSIDKIHTPDLNTRNTNLFTCYDDRHIGDSTAPHAFNMDFCFPVVCLAQVVLRKPKLIDNIYLRLKGVPQGYTIERYTTPEISSRHFNFHNQCVEIASRAEQQLVCFNTSSIRIFRENGNLGFKRNCSTIQAHGGVSINRTELRIAPFISHHGITRMATTISVRQPNRMP